MSQVQKEEQEQEQQQQLCHVKTAVAPGENASHWNLVALLEEGKKRPICQSVSCSRFPGNYTLFVAAANNVDTPSQLSLLLFVAPLNREKRGDGGGIFLRFSYPPPLLPLVQPPQSKIQSCREILNQQNFLPSYSVLASSYYIPVHQIQVSWHNNSRSQQEKSSKRWDFYHQSGEATNPAK